MAIYKSEGDKPWKVLDDYTFSVLAEFATCREAEKYAHNNGQSDIPISRDEYQQIVG